MTNENGSFHPVNVHPVWSVCLSWYFIYISNIICVFTRACHAVVSDVATLRV